MAKPVEELSSSSTLAAFTDLDFDLLLLLVEEDEEELDFLVSDSEATETVALLVEEESEVLEAPSGSSKNSLSMYLDSMSTIH